MASFQWIKGEKKQQNGGKNRETPHPLGAHNLVTITRGHGNQIIGEGVRIRSTLLRHTMTVMMRYARMERQMLIWGSMMMIVTLAQRLVIVTLAQKLMILARLRRVMTLVQWIGSWMDRRIEPVPHHTYCIPLMILHLNREVTLVRIRTCQHLQMMITLW